MALAERAADLVLVDTNSGNDVDLVEETPSETSVVAVTNVESDYSIWRLQKTVGRTAGLLRMIEVIAMDAQDSVELIESTDTFSRVMWPFVCLVAALMSLGLAVALKIGSR